jgi:hypothetical protein
MQFSYDKGELRYAFIQNPYNFITKEEYAIQIFTPEELEDFSEYDLSDLINENE